ncbi:hypothetical protein [Paenibacillus sp. XY044]|uniref:hypothetical protein n=1 Tax=Paenibacillus sp. XY044 TaxID=2026089 RepID=UPI000B97FAA6|nr:hypothetical protein [Paenibacillus sp. XY044]OZB95936.1 hypothetical protein CJP46_08325 [Paenibacillus sp. XY044]
MAETLNYRMNLVIDLKNVIKANRELRAMERYFERIQGRVLKIGRTRMVPEIALKDSASKGLDSLLEKINRVKSQVIRATATVDVAAGGGALGGKIDFSTLVTALQDNSAAVKKLTETIGELKIGGEKKDGPKSTPDKIKDVFSALKSFGGGLKSAGEIPDKGKAIGKAWRGEDKDKAKKDLADDPAAAKRETPLRTETYKRKKTLGRAWKTMGATGDLIGTIGSAGEGVIGGIQGLWKSGKEFFGGSKNSAIANSATKAAQSSGIAASTVKAIGSSGIMTSAAKGIGKNLPGVLGFAADAISIMTAKTGKERAQAIGSSVGGGVGTVLGGFLGSVIPGGGTAVGAMLGGAAGGYIGDKVGGWVSDLFSKKKKKDKPAFVKPESSIGSAPTVSTGLPYGQYAPPAWTAQKGLPGMIYPNKYVPPTSPLPPSSKAYGPYLPRAQGPAAPMGTGPRLQAASGGVKPGIGGNGGGKTTPQLVQISPEQMSALSGFLKDFKTETNYNLPAGAVQVTVHEETPIDVEGLILQIGQRLRSEFAKAAQNRKPGAKAYV